MTSSFILTKAEARRLPPALIVLLGALYLLPGLFARDPWAAADAEGLGIALTMAGGTLADWLAPNIFGQAAAKDGPLAAWISACAILVLGPFTGEQTAARLVIGCTTACGLTWIWLAVARLAARPEVQPADPFEASAAPADIGRAVADAALLVTMATCGLIARIHETTAMAVQFAWTAAWLLGAAIAVDRPVRGGLIAGAALAATVLTRGMPTAGFLLLALLSLPLLSQRYRLVARPLCLASCVSAAILLWPWPLAVSRLGPEGMAWMQSWLAWNAAEIGLASERTLVFLARNMPWYLWPTWPLAIWAAWHWRHRWQSPALSLPVLMAGSALLQMLLSPSPTEATIQPAAIAFAVLAALGLPAVRRSLVSLLDWVSVATYSVIGCVLWAYWLALHTGFPPRMADSAERLAPGFSVNSVLLPTLAGLAASAGWLVLVWWRTSRRPRVIWRPMVLSCGGLVLTWCLLIVLWLPMYDARVSYRHLAAEIASVIARQPDCVRAEPIEPALRANLAYFGKIRFAGTEERCPWLLSRHDEQGSGPSGSGSQWQQVWQGRRPFDSTERLTLYRRRP